MASNSGKFIDRSPVICPAGKLFGDGNSAENCLKEYTLEDKIDAIKHDEGIFEERCKIPFKYKQPPLKSNAHVGIYTESRPVLRPPTKTRFETLINDLKETSYQSYWNKELGKCRDPTPGLPAGTEPHSVTFGAPTKKGITVKELVNPPKGVYEVLWDSQIGHDMYKMTHNDYNPGEQICRNYLKPAFNPNKCYGKGTAYDARGIWVRCACEWHQKEPLEMASKIQTDFSIKWKPLLGKGLAPNRNIECVPKGYAFGTPSKREMYGLEDLIKDPDCTPCLLKRDFYEWMTVLNNVRNLLKRRNVTFDFEKFCKKILFYDKEHIQWMDKTLLYKICDNEGVHFQHSQLEPLLMLLGILQNGGIHYESFVNLLNTNQPMPDIFKINDIPPNNQYYTTSYNAAICDYLIIDNSVKRTAGIPSQRFDLSHPPVPSGQCLADKDNFGDETTSGALLNPSIFTNYGLTHRDFFMPRSKDVIKSLFENVGYKINDTDFERLWNMGLEHDKTGSVCVDTFNTLVNLHVGSKIKCNEIKLDC